MKRNFTYDSALILKDAGAVTVSGAAQVGGAAKILDLGAGFVEGKVVIDISAIAIDGKDEIYDIVVQLGEESDFATKTKVVERCSMSFSAAEVTRTDGTVDAAVGRYVLPFDNELAGKVYRYMGLYTVAAGATVSINYTAHVVKS